MLHGHLEALRALLIVGAVCAIAAIMAPHAFAKPAETENQSSQRGAPETFTSAVETQTERALAALHRAADRAKTVFAEFKARFAVETLRAALNDRKGRLATLDKDVTAMLDRWRPAIADSWAKMQRSAAEALANIAAWMRAQSESEKSPETHV
jgi:hypothetical protein